MNISYKWHAEPQPTLQYDYKDFAELMISMLENWGTF